MKKNIAILLPYKDQFIRDNAGSASIWVKDFSKNSKFKKNTTIFSIGYLHKERILMSLVILPKTHLMMLNGMEPCNIWKHGSMKIIY